MKKKENKNMHTPRHKVIHKPIPTSLYTYITYLSDTLHAECIWMCSLLNAQRCRDGVAEPPKGGVAALPTTSAGGDFGDNGF